MFGRKIALLVFGGLAIAIGLVWIGQDTGIFRYPTSSFMINEVRWVYIGTALAIAGLMLVLFALWSRPR